MLINGKSLTELESIPRRLKLMLGMLSQDNTLVIPKWLQDKDIKENKNIVKALGYEKWSQDGKYSQFSQKKWKDLLDIDFNISNQCCNVMKKQPAHSYQKATGKKAITGQMAEESRLRTQVWLKQGCNGFDSKNPVSNPMSFWTEQDVLEYIYKGGIDIAEPYGQVVHDYQQLSLNGEWESTYRTTGINRSGCIFCAYGCHLEDNPNRFELLKQSHPRQYEYCMNGGEYNEQGLWIPNKQGLGMRHCIEELNSIYGNDFIKI